VKRIEDFEVGEHASFTKTFTEADLQRFIEITGDTNPLHVDDVFAASTPFGRRIVHGMLTASLFSTMVGMLLPGTGAIYRSQTIRFLLPVYLDETVTAHFVIRAVDRAKHRMEIDAWIENEAGERVIEGTCEAGLLRRS
jgi:3-hydroxybutyryl-CoA dehydratase